MKIKSTQFKKFKRFTDLEIKEIGENVKLVVLVGSNGSGKSSVFDGFRLWHSQHDGRGLRYDTDYYHKLGSGKEENWTKKIQLNFHSPLREEPTFKKKLFYFRSAYRNQPDFKVDSITRRSSDLDAPKIKKMIDNDVVVSDNYQRMISNSVYGLYDESNDNKTVKDLREEYIGEVRKSLKNLFKDINLESIGDPMEQGSFYFEKGTSKKYPYKNLSGGEKAAFDLLLDLIVKKRAYNNTVFCIDEPELHMHTKLQGNLLKEVYSLIPENSQLWIATHSIGMMKKAKELYEINPDSVVFLDFHNRNFDDKVTIEPSTIGRKFWKKILYTAVDDLSHLIAPKQIVICEGKPEKDNSSQSEFDASCYREIFSSQYPDTDFISVGNADSVKNDKLFVGQTVQTISSGTNVVRVIDKDDRSQQEIEQLFDEGIKVLSRRNIESYLLDDELLEKLCENEGQLNKTFDLLNIKGQAIANSVNRGNPVDDIKSAAGDIYVGIKRELQLTGVGNDHAAFLKDTMAKLLTPDTKVYSELEQDIFG